MASSLRIAAPKMASMAAQSSVKVARPMMKAQQLQKFSRAYSGSCDPEVSVLEEALTNMAQLSPVKVITAPSTP
jgi:hypothetical protein